MLMQCNVLHNVVSWLLSNMPACESEKCISLAFEKIDVLKVTEGAEWDETPETSSSMVTAHYRRRGNNMITWEMCIQTNEVFEWDTGVGV